MSERGAGIPQCTRSGPKAPLLLWLLGLPAPVQAGEEVLALALDQPYVLLDAPQELRERVAQLDREPARARGRRLAPTRRSLQLLQLRLDFAMGR